MTALFNIRMHHSLDNAQIDEVAVHFGKLFKIEPEKAQQLLHKAPVIIRKGANEETAGKIGAALKKLGISISLEPVLDGQVADAPVPAATPQPDAAQPADHAVNDGGTVVSPPDHPGYPFRIEGRPDFSFLTVMVPGEQMVKVEASAMATMDTNVEMGTKMRGGLSRLLTGESIFINEFHARGGAGEVGIAPGAPGDMGHVYLDGNVIYLQNSAFVACGPKVEIETKWQGLTKGFFSGESLFLIRAVGQGDLWFNTYGAMIEIDVDGEYVVDTGNIVAFTEGLEYKVSKVGGYKSLFFSGEGFVCRFSGKGKVWIQTRGVQALLTWVHPFRPIKKRG